MIRLNKIAIPKGVDQTQLMGATYGLMSDCVYNSIVCGEYDGYKHSIVDIFAIPEINEIRSILKSQGKDFKAHQVKDLSMMLAMDNVFNINKPGYGKTLETIAWVKAVLKKDFRVLVLCPKSVVGTWQEQLKEYWPDYLQCGMWWITNYEQLYDETRGNIAKELEWDLIVLDESHTIKSMKSKISLLAFKLKGKHRHCLSGTSIWNRPEDLAAQLKFLDPTAITTYTDFVNCFCHLVRGPFGFIPKGLTKNKIMEANLRKLLYLYCVGGEVHDMGVASHPEHIRVRLKLDKKVREYYLETVGKMVEIEKERVRLIDTKKLLDENIKVQSSIEQTTRLQQLTSCPQQFNSSWKNVKFEWILDWLENTDEKVIIMSKYATTIDYLESCLSSKKIKLVRIKQSHTPNERTINFNKFREKDYQALIGTYGVLSTGVDGLQYACHYMIFIDHVYTASELEQAEGRIARTGQKEIPVFYVLQAIGTIDNRIIQLQKVKGLDAKAILENISVNAFAEDIKEMED